MMGIDHLGVFIVAGLVLNLTPGPDVLFIVSSALRRGVHAGLVAALGITAGCLVHVAAATVGVSALVAASSTAFNALKWLGAAYLVVIGIGMLRARASGLGAAFDDAIHLIAPDAGKTGASAGKSLKDVFLQGFWTNALNPKVALFFLAFLPQFIDPATGHQTLAFLLLGLIFSANGLWVNAGWALLAAWAARRLGGLRQRLHWVERGAGALFVAFGVRLALTDAPAR